MIAGYYEMFVILGIVVSLEDWREKRIRNRWIAIGFLVCAAGFGYLFLNSVLGYRGLRLGRLGEFYVPWHYYPRTLAHLALSFTAGYTLWRLSVWPAGDAKLYTLFAFFTALINPNLPGFPLLLFMVLLVNIFVPAGTAFAGETILRGLAKLPELLEDDLQKQVKAAVDRSAVVCKEMWPRRYEYLTLFTNLFGLFFLMRFLELRFRGFAPGPFGHLLVFLGIFVLWDRVVRLLRNERIGVFALFCVCAAAITGSFYLHYDVWDRIVAGLKMTANFTMFLSFSRTLFYWFIERQSLRDLETSHLEGGLVLSNETWERLKTEKELEGKLGDRYSDGLTEAEAQSLKDWLAARAQPAGCTFYQTIPFAIWVFLGTLLTLANRGSAVVLLGPYLRKGWDILRSGASWGLS